MSDWFFMLGEALDESERQQVRDYLHGLGIDDEMPVVNVSDWNAARRAISDPSWDRRWWDAEQTERKRLHAQECGACAERIARIALASCRALERSSSWRRR